MQKGISIFRYKIFVSQFRKISSRNPRCFRKFRVSKNFMSKRGRSRFSIENLLSHNTENLRRGAPFFVSQNFWYRKNLWIRGGGEYHDFLSKFFCLTVPKNFVGKLFSVSLISGIEKFYASESYVTILCRNFFCFSAEKFRRVTLLICVSENFRQPKSLWN